MPTKGNAASVRNQTGHVSDHRPSEVPAAQVELRMLRRLDHIVELRLYHLLQAVLIEVRDQQRRRQEQREASRRNSTSNGIRRTWR